MKKTLFDRILKLFPSTVKVDEVDIIISDSNVEFCPKRFCETPLEWKTVVSGQTIIMDYEDIPQKIYNRLMAFKEQNAICSGYCLYANIDRAWPDSLYEDLPF